MKQSQKLVAIAVCLLLVLAGAWAGYRSLSEKYQPAQPQNDPADDVPAAPDFSVLDEAGSTVRLSDKAGKPVIINFWATWCGPCQSEMPAFDAAFQRYGDQVTFMMVNLTDGARDTVESAKAFAADRGYTFPLYFDTEYSGAMAYGVNAIPATVLVDEAGNLVGSHVGAMSEDQLATLLAGVLEGD